MPPPQSDSWDLILRPKTGWFDLNLADLWRYRDLTMMFFWRDFVAQFKQTVLGPLWYLIQPLFTTLLFTLIFSQVAQLSTEGLPPILFYLSGITAWNYFSECLNRTSGTFVNNAAIFGKVYFPRLTVPLSIVMSNLVKFGIQFMLFLVFLLFYWVKGANVHPSAICLLAPVLLLIMAALGLGTGIIVSALTTKYRDLQILLGFGVQLAMYATPVIYPASMVTGKLKYVVLANPMAPVIETFRYGFLGAGTFNPLHLAYSAAITVFIVAVGIVLFNHVERTFMDTV